MSQQRKPTITEGVKKQICNKLQNNSYFIIENGAKYLAYYHILTTILKKDINNESPHFTNVGTEILKDYMVSSTACKLKKLLSNEVLKTFSPK